MVKINFFILVILLAVSSMGTCQITSKADQESSARPNGVFGDSTGLELKSADLVRIETEALTGFSTNHSIPYWMRANRFGSIPIAGFSMGLVTGIFKEYDLKKKRRFDWGIGFQSRLNLGTHSEMLLVESYIKTRLGIFELKGGRSKDIMGIVDSTLSTGSFSVSGNSLGIPKVQLSIPQFWAIPVWENLFSVKGSFAFGWFGSTQIADEIGDFQRSDISKVKSYFHQKSLYGKMGRPSWRLNIIAGFNHQTMFGNEDKIFSNFNLTKIQTFYYAVVGKTWYDGNGANSKLGNQIGTIDLGINYEFNKFCLQTYRQQFYDVGALAHLANVRDGLTGISFQNKAKRSRKFYWKKLLIEHFYSKNQAGELWSKPTPSGDEAYYNNFMYLQGWSYKGVGIGNPLITPKHEARTNLRSKPGEFFVNNRVIAFHTGMDFAVGSYNFLTKLTYSDNFGTYGTSSIGTSRNKLRFPISPPYFQAVKQFSGLLECYKLFNGGWQGNAAIAFDSGRLLYNSFGIMVGIKKTFKLF